MTEVESIKQIKIKQLENIENNEIEEIERLKQIQLSELNKFEKIKLEGIEHLEQIKISQIERFKQIKEEEKEKLDDIKNNYIEYYGKLYLEMNNELKIFSKNEMAKLELIEKDGIEGAEKINNEEIEQHKNNLRQKIKEHKKFLKQKMVNLATSQKYEIKHFKKRRETQSTMIGAGPLTNTNKYQNDIKIRVMFRTYNSESNNEVAPPIVIECSLNDKIAQLIEKYNERIWNISQNTKFIYNNNILSPDLTLEEEELNDGCLIKVING